MRRLLGKRFLFGLLLVLVAISGFFGLRHDRDFVSGIWTQLFWLFVGILATTFVLEAVLEQDLEARNRQQDSFAFRTFAANLLGLLLDMARVEGDLASRLVKSAVSDSKGFAKAAEDCAKALADGDALDGIAYDRHRLDLDAGLRDLSRNYIRLFSPSPEEMFANYRRLQDLASDWTYRDELTEPFVSETERMSEDDPSRGPREARSTRQRAQARDVLRRTAVLLAELAREVAKR